jgi:hypothetical protein
MVRKSFKVGPVTDVWVWKSWANGMKFFRRNPRITKLWDDDLKTDAYYGLSFDTKDDDGTTCKC